MNPPSQAPAGHSQVVFRWVAMSVFMLTAALNFLDRQLLAALAPTLKNEFQMSNTQYGELVSVFFLAYSAAAPLSGWFIDRVGLNAGASIAVTLWSMACAATGLVRSLPGFIACRLALGIGESGCVPAGTKAGAVYLKPEELGLMGAMGATCVAIGSTAAPLLAAALAPRYGWRFVFLFCGLLGLLWTPLWLFTSRRIPHKSPPKTAKAITQWALLRNRNLWSIAVAFGLALAYYSLWVNWTTVYLVEEHNLSQQEANLRFAWIPSICAMLGALSSGLLTFRWIRKGMEALPSRMRACWYVVPLLLAGVSIPYLPSAILAVAAIGLSVLAIQSIMNNILVMPVDLFGSRPAAFATSVIISVSAVAQALASPIIGAVVDRFGFPGVCVAAPVPPLIGIWLTQYTLRANKHRVV